MRRRAGRTRWRVWRRRFRARDMVRLLAEERPKRLLPGSIEVCRVAALRRGVDSGCRGAARNALRSLIINLRRAALNVSRTLDAPFVDTPGTVLLKTTRLAAAHHLSRKRTHTMPSLPTN